MSLVVRPGTVTDTTADRRWVPFQVRAVLADPVVTAGDRMHLDGPLSWCAYLAARENGVVLPQMSATQVTDFRLPLATWTVPAQGGTSPSTLGADELAWGWACSRALPVEHGTTAVDVRKKPPTLEYSRYTEDRRHHDALGPHKARNVTYPGRLTPVIEWWALGDPDAAADLLTRLRAVGRVTGHGNGRVLSIDVVCGRPDDRDRWRDRDWPDPGGAKVAGIRAPYWHPLHRARIA